MRSFLAVFVVAVVAYVGILGAESIELPPARVVDAIADTSNLANGTAAYLQSEPDASEHTLGRPTSTSVPPSTPTTVPQTTSLVPTTPPGVVATSASPTTTAAPTTTTTAVPTTPPPPSARERGEMALASYSYDWQLGLPGWEISFHPGRKGVLGYTFVQEKRIEVYVRSDMSDPLLAHVIAHEIGHAIDVSNNTGDDRRRWQELRGIEDKPWWPGNGATDFSTGAGDFAESFAAWQVGSASFRSNLGDPPDAEANALMAELAGA